MTLPPDPEKVVGAHLRDALAAIGAAVVGRTPPETSQPGVPNTSDPWVRITLLDAPSEGSDADHLLAAYLQCDCYAGSDGGQEEANLIVRTARGALAEIAGVHDGAVVAGARIDGCARIPDTEFEPARERVVLTTTIWMHA